MNSGSDLNQPYDYQLIAQQKQQENDNYNHLNIKAERNHLAPYYQQQNTIEDSNKNEQNLLQKLQSLGLPSVVAQQSFVEQPSALEQFPKRTDRKYSVKNNMMTQSGLQSQGNRSQAFEANFVDFSILDKMLKQSSFCIENRQKLSSKIQVLKNSIQILKNQNLQQKTAIQIIKKQYYESMTKFQSDMKSKVNQIIEKVSLKYELQKAILKQQIRTQANLRRQNQSIQNIKNELQRFKGKNYNLTQQIQKLKFQKNSSTIRQSSKKTAISEQQFSSQKKYLTMMQKFSAEIETLENQISQLRAKENQRNEEYEAWQKSIQQREENLKQFQSQYEIKGRQMQNWQNTLKFQAEQMQIKQAQLQAYQQELSRQKEQIYCQTQRYSQNKPFNQNYCRNFRYQQQKPFNNNINGSLKRSTNSSPYELRTYKKNHPNQHHAYSPSAVTILNQQLSGPKKYKRLNKTTNSIHHSRNESRKGNKINFYPSHKINQIDYTNVNGRLQMIQNSMHEDLRAMGYYN